MIPIYEQGSGKGIGHGREQFIKRFDEICVEHLEKKRARSFAFVFYDFNNKALRKILRDQGVFAELDRVSGRQLSLFYLHGGDRGAVESFNQNFLSVLGVEGKADLPCVVFFKVDAGNVSEVKVAQLDSADLVHGFKELAGVVEEYLSSNNGGSGARYTAIKWLKVGGKFVTAGAFSAILKKGIEYFF
ncbi:hypothetical protein ACRCF9_11650 [Pseudomonas canadensis]|uniref:hypothetical protein n=1 Tax=Pseudomonas TaxID=286 RepID=UPI003D6C3AE7